MPRLPKKPCAHPGCGALVDRQSYCDQHLKAKRQRLDQQRGSAASRGYDARWRKARDQYLREHPLCVMCERRQRVTAATVVDHIIPHRGDPAIFWDRSNWQSLCKPHHDSAKQREEKRSSRSIGEHAGPGGG